MYTLKDYWIDIITHAKRLDKYLTPYDIKVVNTCLEASCGTLTSTINEIVSDIEYIHQFALCKEAMRTAKLVQEDSLVPTTKLASVIMSMLYYIKGGESSFPSDKQLNIIGHILEGFNELNPQRPNLYDMYSTIASGEYNLYMIKNNIDQLLFLNYPNTIVKVYNGRGPARLKYMTMKELLVSLSLSFEDNLGIRPILSYFLPTERDIIEDSPFTGLVLYQGGELCNTPYEEVSNFFVGDKGEALNLAQQRIDSYKTPDKEYPQIQVDSKSDEIEPIYIQGQVNISSTSEEQRDYQNQDSCGENGVQDLQEEAEGQSTQEQILNINYPYLLPDLNTIWEYTISIFNKL